MHIPKNVKTALDDYLKLDRKRRSLQHRDNEDSTIFQPLVNYRTSGGAYRQVQMMSRHKSVEMVVRYDHQRENLAFNAVNFLDYEEAGTLPGT